MTNTIPLSSTTKLSDLLAKYPWLKESLPEIHENFKLLSTPLGAVMARKATISMMSQRSGLEEDLLIEKLTALINQHESL